MIDGVIVTPLRQIHDDRGAVYHMMRKDSAAYNGFGEVYFSLIKPDVIKGWRKHLQMTMNLCCVQGLVLVVLYDENNNQLMEIQMGGREDDYKLITVPPGIWAGYKCKSDETAVISNFASILHDPAEAVSQSVDNGPVQYDWDDECLKSAK